ncbi:MAG TPA: MFS transporter [Casimicrobiaceae bacterium]|nr:MFS transporter [Casimicrobiaceae bacterium]
MTDYARRAGMSLDAQAVMVLVLCFALNMVGRGVSDSYAVFLVALSRDFTVPRAQLIGPYSASLLVFAGSAPFAGALLDRYGHRALYLIGLSCLALALFIASAAEKVWQMYAAIGVLGGISLASLGMIPAATLLKRWFLRRLSTAIGLAYTGLGCGVLLIVPLAQHLIELVGWRTTYRIIGSAVGVIALVTAALPWLHIAHGRHRVDVRTSLRSPGIRSALQDAWSRPVFWGLAAVFFFTSVGMYMMLIQMVAYLIAVGTPAIQAASSFGMVGALSVVGMVTSGLLAGRIGFRATGLGSFAITLTGIALLALLHHAWTAAALFGAVLLFGISQGTRGPLVATLSARLFAGPAAGSLFGIITATGALGGAVGSLLAGVLYDLSGGYALSFVVAAMSLVCAALPFLTMREFRTR